MCARLIAAVLPVSFGRPFAIGRVRIAGVLMYDTPPIFLFRFFLLLPEHNCVLGEMKTRRAAYAPVMPDAEDVTRDVALKQF